jgi:hypothetical protein
LEQSYLSSEQNQTNGFIRADTSVQGQLGNTAWDWGPWAIIRDLGSPSANNNQSIAAAIGNPDGTITSSSLSSIGYSIDFLVGLSFDRPVSANHQYSMGPIVSFGATTPLSSTTATLGYVVPALGTEECSQLQARFASPSAYKQGYSPDLVAGTGGTATTPNTTCLFNIAGGGDIAVTTLAFAGTNRANFLEKWEAGLRTVYRSHTGSNATCASATSASGKTTPASPCQRGIVDFTVGQDAAITRGLMRHFVLKIDGTQPFPYSNGYFFLYGTAALRFERNTNLAPLILMAASSSTLQTIPSSAVFVEPLTQPDKDFYRIGVAISLDKIFSTLKTK